jgi:glucose 1-dehydrogenase
MSRFAVVTGSSGGIGKAVVQAFVKSDYHVFCLDTVKAPSPKGSVFIQTDVSSDRAVSEAFKQICSHTDRLNAVVNNAGVSLTSRLVDTTPKQWDRVMAVNLKSVYLVTRAAYRLLRNSEHPAVVNVASVHAVGTSNAMAAYAASKGGITALTRAMALEMSEDGIRVNCVLPGAVDTPMLREGCRREHLGQGNVERAMERLAKATPLGRIGDPVEIAQAVLFLASWDSASFVTGQTLVADGGALARLSTE